MPLLSATRFLAALLSLLLLVAAGYLLWSWYDGLWVRDATGALFRLREPWRLGVGAALLAWCLLGRTIMPLLLARRDGRRTQPRRLNGQTRPGATGSSLYVEHHGPLGAPVIVFTHGWGMDSTFWDYARQDLANRFRLVLWDLPGLGRSKPPPNGEVSVANFAKDLRGLLETLDRPAVLVGHSIGGMTLQTLVRDHPEALNRVAGFVLLNTTYTNPLRTMLFGSLFKAVQKPLLEPATHMAIWLYPLVWLSKWQSYLSGSLHLGLRFGFGRFVTRSQLEHVALLSARARPAIEAKGNLAMFHWDATDALVQLRKPVLVLGGDLDIVTKLEASQTIAAETHVARLQVVNGVNHMGPLERAELYNEAIAEFALSVQPVRNMDERGAADVAGPSQSPPPPRADDRGQPNLQ